MAGAKQLPGVAAYIMKQLGYKPPKDAFFDLSNLADVPEGVPQRDLPVYEPPRGPGKVSREFLTEENMDRVDEVVKRGMLEGGLEWYNTSPIRAAFMDELGDEGAQAFGRFMDFVAATSPRSKVSENIKRGSMMYHMDNQGTFHGGLTNADMPKGYGHLAHETQMHNLRNLAGGGSYDSVTNPKTSRFSQNLQGNYRPVTVDSHNHQLITGKNKSPNTSDYQSFEATQQDRAGRLGIHPAQYQASAWIGGAEETGVANAKPFTELFDVRVRHTADKMGISPMEVMKKFVRGEIPLMGITMMAGVPTAGVMLDKSEYN